MMVAGSIWSYLLSPLFTEPPLRMLTAEVVKTAVPQGGELIFRVESRSVPKHCHGVITREFWQCVKPGGCQIEDDDAWVKRRSENIAAPVTPPRSSHSYYIAAPLPDQAPPGDYVFFGQTVYSCPWWRGNEAPMVTHPLPFKIVPKGAP